MLNYDTILIPEATDIQNNLRYKVSLSTSPIAVNTIAGADISHDKNTEVVFAGIIVLSYPNMELLSYSLVETTTKFPYVPQYLGFREVPALLEAWKQLPVKPDVLVLDGQGITHPRRMGIASHFGVLSGQPTIGCAKNMLYGTYPALPLARLGTSPITDGEEVLGYALRTKENVKPVYISPGHLMSVEDSIKIMKQCTLRHRIPEPTRLAHEKVNLFRVGRLQAGFHVANVQGSLFE